MCDCMHASDIIEKHYYICLYPTKLLKFISALFSPGVVRRLMQNGKVLNNSINNI
jgi:hypothetical protein